MERKNFLLTLATGLLLFVSCTKQSIEDIKANFTAPKVVEIKKGGSQNVDFNNALRRDTLSVDMYQDGIEHGDSTIIATPHLNSADTYIDVSNGQEISTSPIICADGSKGVGYDKDVKSSRDR